MNRTIIIALGILMTGLLVFSFNSYYQIKQLKKNNQELQGQIQTLKLQNSSYQEQLQQQMINQSVKENDQDAKTKAIQFVTAYNSVFASEQQRNQRLKPLMTANAFDKLAASSQQEEQTPNQSEMQNLQSRVEIKNVNDVKLQQTHKVHIEYDHIVSIDNRENHVERMNMSVDLVISKGQWLVNHFELSYQGGQENEHMD